MVTVPALPWERLPLGCAAIDRQLSGGLPRGSLTLIEGPHAAGKTVLCQYLTHSALRASRDAGQKVAYYSSDVDAPSLISRMAALGLDVLDDFLLDHLRIYPLALSERYPQPQQLLGVVLRHLAALPESAQLVVLDSPSPLLVADNPAITASFFAGCATLCRQGRTIVMTLSSRQVAAPTLAQAQRYAHLSLRLSNQVMLVEQVVKTLEITGGPSPAGQPATPVCFDVVGGDGIRVLPATRPGAR